MFVFFVFVKMAFIPLFDPLCHSPDVLVSHKEASLQFSPKYTYKCNVLN